MIGMDYLIAALHTKFAHSLIRESHPKNRTMMRRLPDTPLRHGKLPITTAFCRHYIACRPRTCIVPVGLVSCRATYNKIDPITTNSLPVESPPVEDQPGFADLGVDRLFLPGMAKMKVTRPSDIQAAVIPEILSTDNVALQSYTGSGKTLAFLLPAMTLAIARAEALYKAGQQEVPLQLLVVAPSQVWMCP